MKKTAIYLYLMASVFLTYGQDIAPFQWENEKAQTIDQGILDQLLYKNWYCYERKFSYKRKFRVAQPAYQIYFNENKTCIINIDGVEEAGTWDVVHKNLLVLQLDDSEKYEDWNHSLVGGHNLYKIDENQLILVKTLTSDHDNKIILYFESEARHQGRALAVKTQQAKKWEEKQQKAAFQKTAAESDLIGAEPIDENR